MKKNSIIRAVLLSILTMIVTLSFYSVGGAIVQIKKINSTDAILVYAIFIWLSVVFALALQIIRKKSLKELGFKKVTFNNLKKIYYCIPIIALALVSLITGIKMNGLYIVKCLFLTLSIGFAEEIYFRGYMFQIWKNSRCNYVILVSSFLFALSHIMNLMVGAEFYATLMQIAFNFAFGVACALMYIMSKSIWPCIVIHFLSDFASYISYDGSNTENIIIIVSKIVLILVYLFMLVRQYRKDENSLHFA